jgi:hypothetical protein
MPILILGGISKEMGVSTENTEEASSAGFCRLS